MIPGAAVVNSAAMRRPWKIVAITAFTLAVLLGSAIGNRVLAVTDETRERLRLYTELVSAVHERYGGEVSYRDLVYASIQGMLRTLDPHTNFLSSEAYASMRDRQQSSFYGLGILVGMRNSVLTVISPLDGTPGGATRHPRRRHHLDDRRRSHGYHDPGRGGAEAQGPQGHPGQDRHRAPGPGRAPATRRSLAPRSLRPRCATPT